LSKEDIERLSVDAKNNADLAEQIKEAGTDMQALVKLAADKGYNFTEEELKEYAEAKKGALSEEQLKQVAGGKVESVVWNVVAVV